MSSLVVAGSCSLFFQLHRRSAKFWNVNEWRIHSIQTTLGPETDPHWVCVGKGKKASKAATGIQDSTGPGRWELNGDKRPLWWHLTPGLVAGVVHESAKVKISLGCDPRNKTSIAFLERLLWRQRQTERPRHSVFLFMFLSFSYLHPWLFRSCSGVWTCSIRVCMRRPRPGPAVIWPNYTHLGLFIFLYEPVSPVYLITLAVLFWIPRNLKIS